MAMFIIAFYAFLRVGEITVRSLSKPNLLLLSNVSFKTTAKASCMIITITNFKHNLGKNPVHLEIKSQPFRSFCPVQIMKNYLKVRGAEDGPLFCYTSGRPIPRSEFCKYYFQCSQELFLYIGIFIHWYKLVFIFKS